MQKSICEAGTLCVGLPVCMPGTAQKSHRVCSLSSDHLPFTSCIPHFPSMLCGFFLESSAQNLCHGTGLGKVQGTGVCLPPPSAISHTQKGNRAAASMQACSAQQAGSALAVVTMVMGPAAWPP